MYVREITIIRQTQREGITVCHCSNNEKVICDKSREKIAPDDCTHLEDCTHMDCTHPEDYTHPENCTHTHTHTHTHINYTLGLSTLEKIRCVRGAVSTKNIKQDEEELDESVSCMET